MATVPYSGDLPVLHRVRIGESLGKISGDYKFQSWRPIYIYNTAVHPILGSNPNQVRAGDEIWIPRSKTGYDKLVRKLRALEAESIAMADQALFQLEAEWNRHQGARVLFDLAGDVLTLVATVGAKVFKAAQGAKVAAVATGKTRAAAQYLAKKEAERLATDLRGTLKDKVVNALATKVDQDLGEAQKRLYSSQKKGVEAIRGVSLQRGKSLLDIADLVLDYVSVSNVADGLMALTIGQITAQTYEQAQQTIRDSVRVTQASLKEKIQRIEQERRTIWGQ